MFEVYDVLQNGRLGVDVMITDNEGEAIDHLNRLRGLSVPYLYVVNGTVHHEFGPDHGTINLGEDE